MLYTSNSATLPTAPLPGVRCPPRRISTPARPVCHTGAVDPVEPVEPVAPEGAGSPALPFPLDSSLDDTDRAIIAVLIEDARATVSHIAERVGITPATASDRLDRLIGSGSVDISAQVDPALLGRPSIAYLMIHTDACAAEVARAVADLDVIEWVTTVTDLCTVMAQISSDDHTELAATVDTHIRLIPGVLTVTTEVVLRSFTTPYNSQGQVSLTTVPPVWAGTVTRGLDETDRNIVLALQDNGRATLTALAKACGLSVPAIRQRFLKLMDTPGVLIHSRVAPGLVGVTVAATVRLSCLDSAAAVAGELAKFREITWVNEITGVHDIDTEILCRDRGHLAETYRRMRALPTVGDTRLLTYDKLVKSTRRWAH